MARSLSLVRRCVNLIDLSLQQRPGVASYKFFWASNFDGSFVQFDTVPAAGKRSATAANTSPGWGNRNLTRFIFNPADYSIPDNAPIWIQIQAVTVAGVVGPSEAMHLVLPYSAEPNRPLVLKGVVPEAADIATSLEMQLPMQCINIQVQVDGEGGPAQKIGNVDMTSSALYNTEATVTGSTDITLSTLYGTGSLDGETIILNVNGGGPSTLTLAGGTTSASKSNLLAAIGAHWPGIVATEVGTHLVLTDLTPEPSGIISVGAGTANTALGLTSPLVVAGTTGTLDTKSLIFTIDGGTPLTVVFSAPLSVIDALIQINAVLGALATADTAPSSNYLRITTTSIGVGATLKTGAGTANSAVGISTGTVTGTVGTADLQLAFEAGGSEYRVPSLASEFTNLLSVHPSASQLFLRGDGGPTAVSILMALRNNPTM